MLEETNIEVKMRSLESVKNGEKVIVSSIDHKHHSSLHHNDTPHEGHGHWHGGIGWEGGVHRLETMGLRIGKELEMLSNQGFGPILVMVDESRLAIGRGIARKILVRERGAENETSIS